MTRKRLTVSIAAWRCHPVGLNKTSDFFMPD